MKKYEWLTLGIFSCVVLIGILHHEIWLDEAQNWLQSRDNNSISQLYESIRYEGHPILWNLLLFFVTRLTHNVLWMQMLHLLIIITAVGIFIHSSPFSFLEKVLFVFGYFTCFEYSLIARNYSLILLFLFLVAKYYQAKSKNYLVIGLWVALLANTHVLGLILSISITLKLIIDFYQSTNVTKKSFKNLLAGSIILIGILASLIQIIPPGQTPILQSSESINIASFSRIAPVMIRAFIPIPDIYNYHFWNTNLVLSISKPLAAVVTIMLLALPILFFYNKAVWLFIFYFCISLVFSVFILIKLPAVRYAGLIYIFFVFCLWLSSSEQEKRLFNFNVKKPFLNSIFLLLLCFQVAANLVAYPFEISRPFSESKNVAIYLKKEKLLNLDILGEFCESAMFLTYLDKKAYYLDLKQTGSYCHLKEGEEVYNTSLDTMLIEAIKYTNEHKADALFIHYQPINLHQKNAENLVLLKSFTNSVLKNENYYIYKLLYKS